MNRNIEPLTLDKPVRYQYCDCTRCRAFACSHWLLISLRVLMWNKWISFTYLFSPPPHPLCAFVDITKSDWNRSYFH